MTVAELNAKYPLDGGSAYTWWIDSEGRPFFWVNTARGGYELASVSAGGQYSGPNNLVLATDIAKLAQATSDYRRAVRARTAE